MGNTEYDAAEQWAIAAGRHPFIRPRHVCDHDTTDPFCCVCGERLRDDVEACDECISGSHDGEFPFCPCCGAKLKARTF